jgi:hypothetical protein
MPAYWDYSLQDRMTELMDREAEGGTLTPNEAHELRELRAQENAAFVEPWEFEEE